MDARAMTGKREAHGTVCIHIDVNASHRLYTFPRPAPAMPTDQEVPLAPQKEQQDLSEEGRLSSADSSTVQFKEGGVRGWTTALGGYCIVKSCRYSR